VDLTPDKMKHHIFEIAVRNQIRVEPVVEGHPYALCRGRSIHIYGVNCGHL